MDEPCSTRIVPAVEGDLPSVAALAREIWRLHYPPIIGIDQTEYMLQRMYAIDVLQRFIATPGSAFELLRIDERLAGFLAYGRGPVAGEFRLEKLYVHPDYHGRGYGATLIDRTETVARAHRTTAIALNVHQRNAIAIRAYQRKGFVVRRAFANDFGNGRPMDDYEMVKHLIYA